MAREDTAETLVGAIVAVVAIGFLAFAVARAGEGEGGGGYRIVGSFDRVDGVAVGSDVRMSGVKVGAVADVTLDPTDYRAKVTVALDPKVKVPTDSTAKIASDGLLGGAYVSIEPGGSADMLPAGGQFENTQGSVDLITLFASFANQGGGAQKQTQSDGTTP
ncbi:MAG: outer membrane lipid asymmetry maintenance protein MlaD [Alphaproteobacteria bacterium]|nr:outer membrane lipid asymmetry maintenance protein MlaD [Alphaproteobacteria bacterium]